MTALILGVRDANHYGRCDREKVRLVETPLPWGLSERKVEEVIRCIQQRPEYSVPEMIGVPESYEQKSSFHPPGNLPANPKVCRVLVLSIVPTGDPEMDAKGFLRQAGIAQIKPVGRPSDVFCMWQPNHLKHEVLGTDFSPLLSRSVIRSRFRRGSGNPAGYRNAPRRRIVLRRDRYWHGSLSEAKTPLGEIRELRRQSAGCDFDRDPHEGAHGHAAAVEDKVLLQHSIGSWAIPTAPFGSIEKEMRSLLMYSALQSRLFINTRVMRLPFPERWVSRLVPKCCLSPDQDDLHHVFPRNHRSGEPTGSDP